MVMREPRPVRSMNGSNMSGGIWRHAPATSIISPFAATLHRCIPPPRAIANRTDPSAVPAQSIFRSVFDLLLRDDADDDFVVSVRIERQIDGDRFPALGGRRLEEFPDAPLTILRA